MLPIRKTGLAALGYAVLFTLIAAAIIFAVSLADEDARNAYLKTNNVLFEDTSPPPDEPADDQSDGKGSTGDKTAGPATTDG